MSVENESYRTGTFRPPGEPRAAQLTLLLYHRDGAVAVVLRDSQPIVVGRAPEADVVVRDEGVSRQHARFELLGDRVLVSDLESTNGVLVDGRQVTSALIRPGQVVGLGAVTVTLHRLEPGEELSGLESHDRFVTMAIYECAQSKAFGRSFALMLLRTVSGRDELRRSFPRIQRSLRSVDRIALYGPDTLEMLLPQASREDALRLAWSMLGGALGHRHRPSLFVCGLAIYPTNGTSIDELMAAATSAMHRATPEQPVEVGEEHGQVAVEAGGVFEPVVVSPATRSLFELVDRLGASDIPVLIVGETGSGKEVAARAIHARSRRFRGPFLCVNCAAIPASLLESFLFGHVKGAFTGADRDTTGMLEAAHGGTLLLDEIGELTASAQAALLRFLDQRRITRLGSTKETPVDVRILAATNRDINRMCSAGTFREDLLHRINAITVRVPPLREREEDILPLAERFLVQACRANQRDIEGFEPEVARVLRRYRWPGNVRELRNVIERAVVLSSRPLIRVEDLAEGLQGLHELDQKHTVPVDPVELASDADLDLRQRVTRLEAELIIEALRRTGGNRTAAARLLRIPIRTLSRKMDTHKIRNLGFGAQKE